MIAQVYAKSVPGATHLRKGTVCQDSCYWSKKAEDAGNRLNQDLPMPIVLSVIAATAVAMWLIPAIPVSLMGAIIIVIFGFFFATVSSRMVGIVGSSNNPVSGM